MASAFFGISSWDDYNHFRAYAGENVSDTVHRNIQLGPLAMDFHDTKVFQRLKHLHQLGTAMYVFKTAEHTRCGTSTPVQDGGGD